MQQAEIGILMLDTSFTRPEGDIGNPATFPFPVAYEMVENATIERVVKTGDPTLIKPFVNAAKRLQQRGVKAITTSCGFLALFQKEIQHELTVPFYSSSLLQIPLASAMTAGAIGVLTAQKSSLTYKHFQAVNAHHTPIVIAGMDEMPTFSGAIIEESIPLDMDAVALEMKQVTRTLIENHPNVTALVLECTNMPPYRNALREVTKLPIFDVNTLTKYVVGSLR